MNRILRYFLLYGLIFLAIMGIFSSLNNTNPKTTRDSVRMNSITALENGKVMNRYRFNLSSCLKVEGEL